MKTIKAALTYLIGCMLFFSAGQASAQMGEAKVVEYAIEKQVTVNAPIDRVWDSLSNLTALPKYAVGYITAVTQEGKTSLFDFAMKDGSVVKGEMQYLEPLSDNRLCVISLKAPFPQGIQDIEWVLSVKDNPTGNGVIIRWAGVIDGTENAKKMLKQQLSDMFDGYFKGLAGFFQVKQASNN
jgi:uncharacterized protein YndB with AHSA1/START domain